MEPVTKPRVLFVYHTFTKQALKVTEDMERRATGEIRIPPEAESGDYDLVCIGSPTWWLTTCMPIRSYLESDEAGRLLKGKSVAGFVVCRRYWKNNLETVMKLLGTGEYTASGTSGSRFRPPTSSPTVTTRPEPSPANSPTVSAPPAQRNERGKDGFPCGRHRNLRVGSC